MNEERPFAVKQVSLTLPHAPFAIDKQNGRFPLNFVGKTAVLLSVYQAANETVRPL